MVESNLTRRVLINGVRALRWPAAALAVGIIWSWAETLVIRTAFDSGPYLSRSFTSALTGRIIFYGLLSLAVWALITLAALLGRRISGRDLSLAKVSRGAVAFWAGAAAWVNLTVVASYLIRAGWGVSFRHLLGVIIPAAAASLVFVAASALLIIRLRRRFAAARAAFRYAGYALLAAALAGAAVPYGYERFRAAARPMPSGLPNVVLITLDAWRADAFRGDISPALTTFARKNGLIFTNARAPSSWTLPSFAAIFTGSYVVTRPSGIEPRGDVRTTWAEVMRDGGYETFAVVHNPHLDTVRFVNRGFTHFDCARSNAFLSATHFYDTAWYFALRGHGLAPEVPGEANYILTEKTLALVRRNSRRPKFIWVHYLDPHYPYQPTAAVLREKAPHLTGKTDLGTDIEKLLPENAAAIKTLYECEVESTDREVARLLAELAAEPHTLVIISADHGEEFFEHHGTRHWRTVYDEVCRVPLVIALPPSDRGNRAVGETSSPVSLVDVAPSVLNYLGLPVPPTMEGRKDILTGGIPADREILVTLNRLGYLAAALIAGDKKVITTLEGDDIRGEYYDLSSDPTEQRPLPWDEEGERLKRQLLTWLDRQHVVRGEGPGGPFPLGDRADLRALGYM